MANRKRPIQIVTLFTALLIGSIGGSSGCSTTSARPAPTKAERARLLLDMGNGALSEGDPTGALESLFEAEALEPGMAEIHHSLALAYVAKGDRASALAEARRAVALKPGYSEANSTLGKLLLDQRSYAEAAPYLQKAAKDPLYRQAYKPLTSLGLLHRERGELAQARYFFDKAIENGKDSACVAYFERGELNMKEERVLDAIHDFRQASKRACAGYGDAHLALARAYERNQEYQEAKKKYLEIQAQFPSTKYSAQAMASLQRLP